VQTGYENLLRNKVLNQMENFILSPQKHLDPTKLTQDEKDMLQRILEDERLIHAEEREYFKNELDALIKASTT
jgi:hypothetical protein